MLSDWIVVVDADEWSTRQRDMCKSTKPPLQGMVDCRDIDNDLTPVCSQVTHFPAFCHVPTNSCVYGLRESTDSMQELLSLVSPSSTQTSDS